MLIIHLVLVLMQSEPSPCLIPIDQAGIRLEVLKSAFRGGAMRKLNEDFWQARPSQIDS
jgi:hypothetical protein